MIAKLLSLFSKPSEPSPEPAKGRAFCVLGMHRSGTSCLTGTLDHWGVFLGEVSKKNPYNIKGNHENAEVVRLNNAVMSASGGSWDNPPASVVWSDEQRAERDRIIAGLAGHARFGFKDPRCLITLEGWMEALPDMQFIGTIRHPLSVALSLTRRDPTWTMERALQLWEIYNRKLLAVFREKPFPLVNFDQSPEEYTAALGRLREALGFEDAMPSGQFFEAELRHHESVEEVPEIPESALALHADIARLAL